MRDPFWTLAARYNDLDGNLGQVVRRALVARALELHLPGPPARVLDVGGDAGQQSVSLARVGYEVTVLDPSSEMLAEAERRLASEAEVTRGRMRLIEGFGERTPEELGASVLRKIPVPQPGGAALV